MLLFIVTIQLGTLFYVWQIGSHVLINKARENLYYELTQQSNQLSKNLQNLEKELAFLSKLEIMDDVLVDDVDKRIAILLQKRAKDLGEGVVLFAMNQERLVASSHQKFNQNDFLSFETKLYASFDKQKKIGRLFLLYPLDSLRHLKMLNPYQHLWLASFVKEQKNLPNMDENIIVSMPFRLKDKEDRLFLAYEKEYALISLHKIEDILLFSFLFSLFLLLLVVWVLSKKQVEIWEHTKEVLEMKKTFLSTMSHELRTPLGSILNLTQHLMLSPKISDDEVKLLGGIENASEHLLSMINNLLQLSKLESNAMPVNRESIELVSLLEELIEMVEPLIEEKSLRLVKKLNLEPIWIESDVNLLKQIIMNLLSNAIKFTDKGSITILLKRGSKVITLSVIDTGIGIKKERQSELFSEFYQAHMGSHDIKHSTGLGLALSQKVAKLIDAKITIESKGEQKGVEATLTIKAV